jgi:uncharacterized protein (TIGR03118 family)
VTKSGKSLFIFATLDGTISGWSPAVLQTKAVIAADRSSFGASYTALTVFTNSQGNSFLYAANNTDGGGIDVFADGFKFLRTVTDTQIPQSFAPYGTRVIGDRLWVTFGGTNKANSGFVDVFRINDNGTLTKLFEANGPLHSPWGLAQAPSNFGSFSNAVLIANNIKDGEINAIDPANGNFLGHLADGNVGQLRLINCGDWTSAKAPAPTAPRTNSSLPRARITMPTDYSVSSPLARRASRNE